MTPERFDAMMQSLTPEQREAIARVVTDPVALAKMKEELPGLQSSVVGKPKLDAREVARAVMRGEPNPLDVFEEEANERESTMFEAISKMEAYATGVAGGLEGFGGELVGGEIGLRKKVLHAGDPALGSPSSGATVVAHIISKRSDGTAFDSTRTRVRSTWDPTLKNSNHGVPSGPRRLSLDETELAHVGVLKAWTKVFPTMLVGERCEVIATAPFCYGEAGDIRLGIAGGECLRFDFELISWKEPRVNKATLSDVKRLATATELKARGTDAFKATQFANAAGLYNDAADYLVDPAADALQPLAISRSERERTQPPIAVPFVARVEGAKELLISCYLNGAQSLLRTELWREAEACCTLALVVDAKNVKALFRRGTARVQLGEFDQARADLREANQLDPKSKEVREMFEECKREEVAARQSEREAFAKIKL